MTPEVENVAAIHGIHTDVTDAAELGELQFQTATAGTLSTKMTIKADGKIGIGTTTPESFFHIKGSGTIIDVENDANTHTGLRIRNTNTPLDPDPSYVLYGYQSGPAESWKVGVTENNSEDFHWKTASNHNFDATGVVRMTLTDAGNVGIGTLSPGYTLHVQGDAAKTSGTTWIVASDKRLKDELGGYDVGLENILKLRPTRFKYKEGNALGIKYLKPQAGLIAQEVEEVIPEAVVHSENGYLSLNYDPIYLANIKATQEQQILIEKNYEMFKTMQGKWEEIERRVASLEEENIQLKEENENLKSRLQRIEQILNINP